MSTNLVVSLKTNIQKLNQSINQIESLSNQIGTNKDSADLRRKLHDAEHNGKELAALAQKNLKELNSISSSHNGDLKIQKERLADELIKLVQRFQQIAGQALKKERQFNLDEQLNNKKNFNSSGNFLFQNDESTYSYSRGNNNNNNIDEQKQEQLKRNQELELAKERDNQMKQLETDIIDLNSMFKDIAIIVHDQQETIDAIENNISNTEFTVMNAKNELGEALKTQSKIRSKKICIIVTVIIIIILIILIVVISLKPWQK